MLTYKRGTDCNSCHRELDQSQTESKQINIERLSRDFRLHRLSCYTMSSLGYQKGDIIKVKGNMLQAIHWAVCVGGDYIIHYQKKDGTKGKIIKEALQEYMRQKGVKSDSIEKGKMLWIDPLSPDEVIRRAESKLGEGEYNAAFSNCEHFAKWCKYNQFASTQAEATGSTIGITVGTGAGVIIGGLIGTAIGPEGTAAGIYLGGTIGAAAAGAMASALTAVGILIHRLRPH